MGRFLWGFILAGILAASAGCSRTSDSANVAAGQTAGVNAAPTNTPLPEFTDADAALAEGTKLLDSGETDKAVDALNQAVRLNPELAEAWLRLGIAYALVEKREQTLEVVEEQPSPTPTPKGKKPVEIKTRSQKAFEKAVAAYKKIIAANDQDDAAHFNLGRAYNKLNEDEDAAKELKEAVKLKPDDTEYQTELGAILIKLAKYAEAIPPLKKALELDPGNLRAEELLSDAEAGKKRVDFATKVANTANRDERKPGKSAESSNSNTRPATGASPVPAFTPEPRPKATPTKP